MDRISTRRARGAGVGVMVSVGVKVNVGVRVIVAVADGVTVGNCKFCPPDNWQAKRKNITSM